MNAKISLLFFVVLSLLFISCSKQHLPKDQGKISIKVSIPEKEIKQRMESKRNKKGRSSNLCLGILISYPEKSNHSFCSGTLEFGDYSNVSNAAVGDQFEGLVRDGGTIEAQVLVGEKRVFQLLAFEYSPAIEGAACPNVLDPYATSGKVDLDSAYVFATGIHDIAAGDNTVEMVGGWTQAKKLKDCQGGLLSWINEVNVVEVVAGNISANIPEDTDSQVILSYTDTNEGLASVCSIKYFDDTQLSWSDCSCDVAGVCRATIKGALNFDQETFFSYTVTVNGIESTEGYAAINILGSDDPPVAQNLLPVLAEEDQEVIVDLVYDDPEYNLAQSCSITTPTNITISTPCVCVAGSCSVGVTGSLNYSGSASFNYTVTANAASSNTASVNLTINAVDDAPEATTNIISNLTEDVESPLIMLEYSDEEGGEASSCSITRMSHVFVTFSCTCSSGVCNAKVKGVTDYYGPASFDYYVIVDGVTSAEQTVNFSINGSNDIPTDIVLSANTISENLSSGTNVGTFSTVDSEVDSYSYSLVSGTGDTDNASFQIDGNILKSNQIFNFESQSSLSIRVQTNDGAGGTFVKNFDIFVTNANDTPTGVTLSTYHVSEDVVVNGPIAVLDGVDQDAGDVFTFSLVSGTGDTSNTLFTIVDNELRLAATLDYELATTHSIRIRVTDSSYQIADSVVQITVDDVVESAGVKQIVSGGDFNCALLASGVAKCWGGNIFGQLGYANGYNHVGNDPNEMGSSLLPIDMQTTVPIKSLSAGANHVCAVLANGEVKCWGNNAQGQLGQENTTDLQTPPNSPINLGTNINALSMVSGDSFNCAIVSDGSVKCWGSNTNGELGIGATLNEHHGDAPTEMGDNLPFLNFGTGEKAINVTANYKSACATLRQNQVKCWGRNQYGQLGVGDTVSLSTPSLSYLGGGFFVQKMSMGRDHACTVITSSGTLKCWGDNSLQYLGYGNSSTYLTAAATMATGVNDVWTSRNFSCAWSALNNLFKCWGDNSYGQAGTGNTTALTSYSTPGPISLGNNFFLRGVSLGDYHTCVLSTDGNVKCFGSNIYGQLGLGTSTDLYTVNSDSINLGTERRAVQISTFLNHNCVLMSDGKVKCWGLNNVHQLGIGTIENMGDEVDEMGTMLPIVQSGTSNTNFKMVAAGYDHTCGLLSDGSIKCWGANNHGQLGVCNYTDNPTPPTSSLSLGGKMALSVYAGKYYSCAIMQDSTVMCWGDGTAHQLGTGSALDCQVPTTINLGSGVLAKKLALGFNHTCAILQNNDVKCWGSSTNAKLGYGNTTTVSDVASSGTLYLSGSNSAKDITLGQEHTCILLSNQSVKCWGLGSSGELGNDDVTSHTSQPDTALNVNLGSGRTAIQIDAGINYTCAVLDDGSAKCWGNGSDGKLGQDSNQNLGDEVGEMSSLSGISVGQHVIDIQAGEKHTCALLADGNIKCWGSGLSGQLGKENPDTVGDSAAEMSGLAIVDLGF